MRKEYQANENVVGLRLDKALSLLDEFSRTFIKNSLDNDLVLVNGKIQKPSYKVKLNDLISLEVEEAKPISLEARDMNLDIAYEDSSVVVINKPRGLVVHPANGHLNDTLVSGLLHQIKDLSSINGEIRPGIVHRIDKDTSGLLIVAKNDKALNFLQKQLKDHTLKRKYIAIVIGNISEDYGRINAPIGRDPKDRKKMAVVADGKPAVTHFRVIERFKGYTLIECELETGRTHQIRVHLAYINKPILGDPLYGPRKIYKEEGQYLHALELEFVHPDTEKLVKVQSEMPDYFKDELERLKNL